MPRLPQRDLQHVLDHTEGLWEDLREQSVFLTGGTGFVGRWLLESLLAANAAYSLRARVVVLTRNAERMRAQCLHIVQDPCVRLQVGDVARFDPPEGRFAFVVHAAVEPSIEPDGARPLAAFDADVEGTRNVLEFARTHGVRRFLFTSSGAVYGKQPPELTHMPEDYGGAPSTMDAMSAYGQAKRVCEFMSVMFGRVYGFDATIARLFAFVGPLLPLDRHYAVGNFIGDALRGGPVRIAGDGTPYRSYLYAADLAIWLWTILLKGRPAYPYNVGSERAVSIAELAQRVVAATAPQAGIEIAGVPRPGARPPRYVPRTARAKDELRLRAWVTLEDGVRNTVQWHRVLESEIH